MIPTTRAEARSLGATRYFTGVPCTRGHVTERVTTTGKCVECKRIVQSDFIDSLTQTEKIRRYRNYRLFSRYGITLDDYNKLSKQQKYRCCICNKKDELVADHCHVRNQFRGLICRRCNSMLGFACDDVEILAKGIQYLQDFRNELEA